MIGIDDAALEAMERYAWPGNVEELHDAVESAFAYGHSPMIGLGDLPEEISGINGQTKPLPTISFETFADAECAILKRALETHRRKQGPRRETIENLAQEALQRYREIRHQFGQRMI